MKNTAFTEQLSLRSCPGRGLPLFTVLRAAHAKKLYMFETNREQGCTKPTSAPTPRPSSIDHVLSSKSDPRTRTSHADTTSCWSRNRNGLLRSRPPEVRPPCGWPGADVVVDILQHAFDDLLFLNRQQFRSFPALLLCLPFLQHRLLEFGILRTTWRFTATSRCEN